MLRDLLPFNFIDLQLNIRKGLGICSVLLALSRSEKKRVKQETVDIKLVYTETLLVTS